MPKGKAIGLCGRVLVICELSNGPGGSCEYVELYVANCALYPEATEVDIRGWIVDDNAGNFNASGCGTGASISNGHLRFADVAAWANVPVGTVIVLFNGPDPADNCYGFTVDESGTGPYFIDVNGTSLIQRTGSNATPNGSGGNCGYCGNSYAATSASPNSWESVLSMSNTADAVQVRCPDCPDAEAGFYHGVAYGSGFGGLAAGTSDVGGAYSSGPGGGKTYELTGAGAPGDGANWTRSTAPTGGTPPTTAGVVDAGVVASLESAALPCCGSFEAPPVVAKADYRWNFQNQIKDVELNTVHFKHREYSPPYGFFDRTDPLWAKYPHNSPYAFSENRVIDAVELEGLEKQIVIQQMNNNGSFTVLQIINNTDLENGHGSLGNGTYTLTYNASGTTFSEVYASAKGDPAKSFVALGVKASEWTPEERFTARMIVESVKTGLVEQGHSRAEVERDVGFMDPSSGGLKTKYAHVQNADRYTKGWSKQLDSRSGTYTGAQSPELGDTGLSLKLYPSRGDAMGYVKSNLMKHVNEAGHEATEVVLGDFNKMHESNSDKYLRGRTTEPTKP